MLGAGHHRRRRSRFPRFLVSGKLHRLALYTTGNCRARLFAVARSSVSAAWNGWLRFMWRFSGRQTDRIICSSTFHGSCETDQHTSAFCSIHSDSWPSPAANVRRVPTRRSSMPGIVTLHEQIRTGELLRRREQSASGGAEIKVDSEPAMAEPVTPVSVTTG